jgi:4-diphosphocytidyl-2-C-methyl-D-erythritol kinase
MLTLRAPAKLNLTLEVLARRSDGYHGIRSVMVPIELSDELAIEPSDRFCFACDRPDLDDERNLAVAALRALGEPPHVRVLLHKRIPVQAGLGGGSSDAAAILRAAMSGALGRQPPRDWLQIARAIGSDVPFFLTDSAALVEGTGERVTPAGTPPRWYAAIVKPPVQISTAAAYAEIDRRERPQRARNGSASLEMLAALQRADFARVQSLLQNDFHDVIAARTPQIARAIDALTAAGAARALLAGSGSCVFALAPDRDEAERIVARLDLPDEYERFASAFASTPDWVA